MAKPEGGMPTMDATAPGRSILAPQFDSSREIEDWPASRSSKALDRALGETGGQTVLRRTTAFARDADGSSRGVLEILQRIFQAFTLGAGRCEAKWSSGPGKLKRSGNCVGIVLFPDPQLVVGRRRVRKVVFRIVSLIRWHFLPPDANVS
jgi:hypothetical protein